MKSAGKARSNGLYRHIRTSKEIIRNLLNDYLKEKRRVPTLGTLLRKNYIMDIERPMVLRRNESNECQNRNSILSFYVDQRKCQAFVL